MQKKVFDKIKKYMNMDKISVFVGAGVSAISGYPSWNKLVRKMSDEIGYTKKNEKKKFSTEELLKIPQIYYNEYNENMYLKKVNDEFAGKYYSNEVHDLIFSLKPKHIMTTNYDTLLEQTSVKFGRNYSVINADVSVSSSVSNQYLIKLHGDLNSKFVLKEQDYLDYESNFMLIDKLVKSIFATTLVIFIGYGLNDYNIKLILNWVKNVQADTFIHPIFIHTGEKLDRLEKKYQRNRGLDVIDSNDFGKFKPDEYLNKYKKILTEIINYNILSQNDSKLNTVENLNNKVLGIENIHYFRTRDINAIFSSEYYISAGDKVGSLSDLFSNNANLRALSNQGDLKRFPSLNCFISHCELKLTNGKWKKNECKIIDNISFLSDLQAMEVYCSKNYKSCFKKYKKAYYLAQLSRYRESYELFTELVYVLKKNEEWDLYYLSQVNRGFLYRIIKQNVQRTSSDNVFFTLGSKVKIYEDEFINKLNYEMKNFVLNQQFDYLPVSFRVKFNFLENLCKNNPYSDIYLHLLECKNNIQQDLASDTEYLAGLSKADTIKIECLEEIKFIYENMILLTRFNEYKTYIKNALISWIEYFANECEQRKKGRRISNNCHLKLTFTDIVILSKTCAEKDIEYLRRIHALNIIELLDNDLEMLKNYLIAQLNSYKILFIDYKAAGRKIKGEKILLWLDYSFELKRLLQVCAYYITDEDVILYIFDLMREILNKNITIIDIVKIMETYISLNKIDEEKLINYVEKWLVNYKDERYEIFKEVAKLLFDCKKENSLPLISKMVTEEVFDDDHLKALSDVFILLSPEAQTKINFISKNSVIDVYRRYKNNEIQNVDIIYEACRVSFDDIIDRRKQEEKGLYISYGAYSDDDIIKMGIFLLIENNCNDRNFLKDYIGINDEFDYWFSEQGFDDNRFNIWWLINFTNKMLDVIKKDDNKKSQMLRILEKSDNLDKAGNYLVRRMFYVYRYLIK